MASGRLDTPAPSRQPSPPPLRLVYLGWMAYLDAWRVQQQYATARREQRIGDHLLLVRHPPTLCTGVLGKDEHVQISEADRQALGLPYHRSDRGGDVMYVGPGQVIAYPILSLPQRGLDPIEYLRTLEAIVIETLADFGIAGTREPGLTGVWVNGAKIAGVAIRVAGGVTTHGFNLNVCPDLAWFRHIVTCGNRGREVTSMERVLGYPVNAAFVDWRVAHHAMKVLKGVDGTPPP